MDTNDSLNPFFSHYFGSRQRMGSIPQQHAKPPVSTGIRPEPPRRRAAVPGQPPARKKTKPFGSAGFLPAPNQTASYGLSPFLQFKRRSGSKKSVVKIIHGRLAPHFLEPRLDVLDVLKRQQIFFKHPNGVLNACDLLGKTA